MPPTKCLSKCLSIQNAKYGKEHDIGKINPIFFSKVNQVIYSTSQMSLPSFKALAQMVFEISCSQYFSMSQRLTMHMSKRGQNFGITSPTEKKREKLQVPLFSILIPYIKFQDPKLSDLDRMQSATTDGRTHGRTTQKQYTLHVL